ncbi:MAG: branched-chain amino acid ABC transporter permease [Eubacteriaceae bacterium]|nr:branched-chain amino acid ABC transporter permease [Eubacteriaceae bacterium]
MLAVSLNLIVGFTGQFSLGHAGFMSIGAYATSLALRSRPDTIGFLIGITIGSVLALVVGVIIGIPTLRLRGDYLGIATLGMAEIIRVVFLNLKITNGAAGLMGTFRAANWTWLYLLTVMAVLAINNFVNSSHGRACISIREDETASEAMGVNTTAYKIIAFAFGAFFAGAAGGLYSSYFYFIKPDLFGFLKSIDMLVIVVLGGLGSITGTIISAILLSLLTTILQDFSSVRMIVYSVILVIIMLFRPQGLMGTVEISHVIDKFARKDKEDANTVS